MADVTIIDLGTSTAEQPAPGHLLEVEDFAHPRNWTDGGTTGAPVDTTGSWVGYSTSRRMELATLGWDRLFIPPSMFTFQTGLEQFSTAVYVDTNNSHWRFPYLPRGARAAASFRWPHGWRAPDTTGRAQIGIELWLATTAGTTTDTLLMDIHGDSWGVGSVLGANTTADMDQSFTLNPTTADYIVQVLNTSNVIPLANNAQFGTLYLNHTTVGTQDGQLLIVGAWLLNSGVYGSTS